MKHSEVIQGTEKEFLSEFERLCYSRSAWQVWADLMSAIACSLSNAVDRTPEHFTQREKEYAQCISRLGSVEAPAKILSILVIALENEPEQDFLGKMYMNLNLSNHWKGQFFTPYNLCRLMSEITAGDVNAQIEKKGFYIRLRPCLRCRGNTDRSSKHHERIQIPFPEPRAFCGAGYRPDYRNDVLHTAFAAWLCRICLYREYAYQSYNRTCAVSAGEGRAGDVVYADVPVKGMEHEAVYQKDGEYKWYCKHSKNSGKRALLSIFRL